MTYLRKLTIVSLAGLLLTASGSSAVAAFVSPDYWSAGDTDSTYQEWEVLQLSAGNSPDVGYQASPAISTEPTLDAVSPGFATGSGNFYSFSGDHGFDAAIYNHGGASGVGGVPAGSGTHVLVQTSATLNGDDGVYSDSVQIVDALGDPVAGGSNAEALRYDVISEEIVSSSAGDVLQREEIWEFYLPSFTDDFQVQGDVIIHSSFSALQVDSMVATSAFATTQVVPEPTGLALSLVAGGFLWLVNRRRR